MDAIRIGGINATKERKEGRQAIANAMAARGSLSFCVVGNVVTSRRHDGTQFGNLGTERRSRNSAAAGSARSATATNPLGNFAAEVGKCGDKSALPLPKDERSGPSFNCLTSSVALAHLTPHPPPSFNPFMTEMGRRKRVVYGLVKPWGLQSREGGASTDPHPIPFICRVRQNCVAERNGMGGTE